MPNVWTLGVWRVKPGREEEFVDLWRQMAREGMATRTLDEISRGR